MDFLHHVLTRFKATSHPPQRRLKSMLSLTLKMRVWLAGRPLLVSALLLPLVIATGCAMSPGLNAAWPWLPELFGGRQSARSVHFIVAALLGGFLVIHLALVILAGIVNELRSIVTGKWRTPE